MALIISCICSCTHQASQCSSNWKVTGFYTPLESEFDSKATESIRVEKSQTLLFNSKFIAAVKIEGWGKTRFGWYLGFYNDRWHKSSYALNAVGQPLEIGAIAVDKDFLSFGSRLVIPSVQDQLNISEFIAVDVGSGVRKRHIDIYTGEGQEARRRSYAVTGQHQVCLLGKKGSPVIDLTK